MTHDGQLRVPSPTKTNMTRCCAILAARRHRSADLTNAQTVAETIVADVSTDFQDFPSLKNGLSFNFFKTRYVAP